MEKELRRYQSILSASGLAVIVFGVWSAAKTLILLFSGFGPYDIRAMLEELDAPPGTLTVLFIIIFIILNIEIFFRLFVGLSARAEAAGKKKRVVYLVFAWIILAFSVLSIISVFQTGFATDPWDAVVTLIIEATSLFALINMIVASGKVRRLRKELATQENK